MNCEKICKNCFIFLLILFLFIYMVGGSGFFEYKLNEKKIMTEEEIMRFEEDVKNGEFVDINDYLEDSSKNYDNSFTKINRSISKCVDKFFERIFRYIFDYVESSS